MALFKTLESENWQVALWKVEESVDELLALVKLNDAQLLEIKSLKREQRQKEKLVSIHLVHLLTLSDVIVKYKPNGAPYIEGSNSHISITHTKGWVAVQLYAFDVAGIDIEYRSDRILRVAHKFIANKELAFVPNDFKTDYFNLIWCAKETLYKIVQKEGLDFIDQLQIEPFILNKDGVITGLVKFDSVSRSYQMGYCVSDDWYLVYRL